MTAPALRTDHLASPCFDTGATFHFYTEVLGFRFVHALRGRSPEWGDRGFLLASYATPDGRLIDCFEVDGLSRPDDGLPRDIRHVGLAVETREALEDWKKRLEAHGVPFWTEEHGGVHSSVYFPDPNGHVFEITHWARPWGERDTRPALEVVRRWAAERGQRAVP
jgi:catechol 2,3-dioxygenase-like lactoylglutathione lyase family enzyme